jgi:hypothetical protein
MPTKSQLSEPDYIVVVLRLVSGPSGALIRGELVDERGDVYERFVGWRGLVRTVRIWLVSRQQDHAEP